MTISMFGNLLGGIGLFLLGMRLMTDGLKYSAGESLHAILEGSTSTRARGILAGASVTSLVQSSGAVTVAAVGFVNAGLVDFGHAVSIIYGSNIGTTTTGWLVSIIGFSFDIKAFAAPAVGLGMLLRVVYPHTRRGAVGDILCGFGVFFLGIGILKETFSGLGQSIHLEGLGGGGFEGIVIFVAIGFGLTFLMQSSSASIAIVLTAVAGHVVSMNDAAAAVIGANVGSTSTAALAAIGATPEGKRLAAAHVIFNIITGLAAISLLPVFLKGLRFLEILLGLESSPTTLLALFHTSFNILGVIIMYPLTTRLVQILQSLWRSQEENEARPKYLDKNVVTTPTLAIHSLVLELKRIGAIARRMAKGAISSEKGPSGKLSHEKEIIKKLTYEVGKFSNLMQRTNLPEELDHQLPNALRVSGYFRAVAELAMEVARLQERLKPSARDGEIHQAISHLKRDTVKLLACADNDFEGYSSEDCANRLRRLQEGYLALKSMLLRAGTKGEISVSEMVHTLDLLARIRRIAEQAEKGARYLTDLRVVE